MVPRAARSVTLAAGNRVRGSGEFLFTTNRRGAFSVTVLTGAEAAYIKGNGSCAQKHDC